MGLSSIQALLVRLHIHGFLYTSDEGQHACCATLVQMLSTRCSVVSTSHCYWSILCTQIIQFCPVVLSTPPCWDSTLLQRQMSLAWNCEQIMLQFDAMPWEGEEGGGAEGGGGRGQSGGRGHVGWLTCSRSLRRSKSFLSSCTSFSVHAWLHAYANLISRLSRVMTTSSGSICWLPSLLLFWLLALA